MKRFNKQKYIILLLTIVFIMTVGFAMLSSNVSINGTSTINSNTWDVHFENLQVSSESTVTGTQTITGDTQIDFSVTLNKPGDVYSFTFDVVNEGSIDAMLNDYEFYNHDSDYLTDSDASYSDGLDIYTYDKLPKLTGNETIKVTFEYDIYVYESDLPTTEIVYDSNFYMEYVQADDNANEVDHSELNVFFEKNDNCIDNEDVGKTFTVDLGDYGEHNVRIVNNDCDSEKNSRTSCFGVFEFTDVIVNYKMNLTDTNVGGWASSRLRTFLNNDIYNALPKFLRNRIISTSAVSGHGSTSGEENFTTEDYLYLLSPVEIYGDSNSSDTSDNDTRQLDYYADLGVSLSSYSSVIKKYGNNPTNWWLRSASSSNNTTFNAVSYTGQLTNFGASTEIGISPAFRISQLL